MGALPPAMVPLAMAEEVKAPRDVLSAVVAVSGTSMAACDDVVVPTEPEADMAQVLILMAHLHRSVIALERCVRIVEVASTDSGTIISQFDQLEDFLGQCVLRPPPPLPDRPREQGTTVVVIQGRPRGAVVLA
jgi:hypothetical protein